MSRIAQAEGLLRALDAIDAGEPPPPMLPPAQPNVIAMQGQSRHRKKK